MPVLILAGGKGSRLGPLTAHRAKPGVPFAGRYRIIDFVLSNFLNSGYRQIYVLTQYMAHSLIRHLTRNWSTSSGMYLEVAPAQMRKGSFWYRGTADAIHQNLNLLTESEAPNVAVFGGDHIYKFDASLMEDYHLQLGADLTVAAFPVPKEEASAFGVIQVDENWRITGFQEKPADPTPIPGQPDMCLVSMGNYIFRKHVLEREANWVVQSEGTSYDFGRDVVPHLVEQGASVYAYDFAQNKIPGEPEDARPYWRDVGTIDSYFQANMDVRSRLPALNLYNHQWRIRTAQRHYPPARFVRHGNLGHAEVVDSLVCEGSIVSSAVLHRVLLGYDCFVHAESVTTDALLLSGCNVGAGAVVSNLLCDKNCSIQPEAVIGQDPEADAQRFPFISESGIVVLPKGTNVPAEGPIEIAHDMGQALLGDPLTAARLKEFEDRVVFTETDRHSHISSGPRYRRYGPGARP
ncbi:MAG: glucose-1-phosphate adenylyltransferase [Planctomycetes bacterium]|nr:glucose-1-phosphate adenylyltransferase [Planctomycetota bacterium]